jgi:hypothetical protein
MNIECSEAITDPACSERNPMARDVQFTLAGDLGTEPHQVTDAEIEQP